MSTSPNSKQNSLHMEMQLQLEEASTDVDVDVVVVEAEPVVTERKNLEVVFPISYRSTCKIISPNSTRICLNLRNNNLKRLVTSFLDM